MAPRHRSYKTEAIVLRQTPLGEADRILTLFTTDIGKLRAVAKGVRRPGSRLGGHLELLNRVSVSLGQGRQLDVVGEVQTLQTYPRLRADLERLSMAIYMAEVIDLFSPERAVGYTVYRLFADTLDRLQQTPNAGLLVRYFEMRLLELSGYGPEFQSCVECRTELQPREHRFSCALGGVLCPGCRDTSNTPAVLISVGSMRVLRLLQRERSPSRLLEMEIPRGLAGETERTLRTYIRFIAERELKSAEFMSLVARRLLPLPPSAGEGLVAHTRKSLPPSAGEG